MISVMVTFKKQTFLKKLSGHRSLRILKKHQKVILLISAAVIALSAGAYYKLSNPELVLPILPPPPSDALYKQADAPIDKRIDDLLSRMSLEEKIGQMALVDKRSFKQIEDVSKYGIGGVLSGAGARPKTNNPAEWRKMVTEFQEQAKQSRLGIPVLYGIDANHGHAGVLGATIFPHAIGLGASGDPKLVKAVARATADELRATNINWNYSPSLDAPKDIRWGRVYEAFSDNPSLNGTLGSAYVEGTQERVKDNYRVIGSTKHFMGIGSMVWGQSNHKEFKIDQGKIPADQTLLENEMLPPYKQVISEQQVGSVMIALSDWGDQRIIENKYLLTDKLKNELGLKGFIVSDWYGAYEYARMSKYDANIKTINAGLDMVMLPYEYKTFIYDVRKAVQENEISEERINDAVKRILYQKFSTGLFDNPISKTPVEVVGSEKHRELAREAVASSAVLLKNNNVLPLSKNTGKILIAGSGADNVGRQSGAWTVEWQGVDGNWLPGAQSILEGIKETVGNSGTEIEYSKDGTFNQSDAKAEVGLAIVSEKPYAEGWGDNELPQLDQADLETIDRLKKSSNKVVVVIFSGRPLIITQHLSGWDGLVAAWLPGSEGRGIADVLFGDKQFSAKLPITWPASIDQVPVKTNGQTNNNTDPLFKRGAGLSY